MGGTSEDWVLINTDAAFIADQGRGGWGAVGRDSDGDMVFAAAGAIQHASDAFQAEADALLQGLILADQLGIGRVKIATDCLTLQNTLTSSKYSLSHIGALLRDIKIMLNLSFIDYQVVYVSRSCNKPAHTLAAHGLAGVQNDHQVWYERVPDDVNRALYGDSTVQV
jgi:hypothetical protein